LQKLQNLLTVTTADVCPRCPEKLIFVPCDFFTMMVTKRNLQGGILFNQKTTGHLREVLVALPPQHNRYCYCFIIKPVPKNQA